MIRYILNVKRFDRCHKTGKLWSKVNRIIGYSLLTARHLTMDILGQRERWITSVVDGIVTSGQHETVWSTERVPAGMYVLRMSFDGKLVWTGKVIKAL